MLLRGQDNPKRCPFPWRDIEGSLGTLDSSMHRTASRSVQPFMHGSPGCPTNRQTDRQTDRQTTLHATYVAIGRIYAMHVMLRKILFDSLVILLLISALRRRITH